MTLTFEQERKALHARDAFLFDSPGALPFSNALFQALLSNVLHINNEVPATKVAFVAFKLAQLLSDPVWNEKSHRVDPEGSPDYTRYLRMAMDNRDDVIAPAQLLDRFDEMWITIAGNPLVTLCCIVCFNTSILAVTDAEN